MLSVGGASRVGLLRVSRYIRREKRVRDEVDEAGEWRRARRIPLRKLLRPIPDSHAFRYPLHRKIIVPIRDSYPHHRDTTASRGLGGTHDRVVVRFLALATARESEYAPKTPERSYNWRSHGNPFPDLFSTYIHA